MLRNFRFPLRILPYAAVLACAALVVFDPAKILSLARDRIFDGYQRLSPRDYVDPASMGLPGVLYVDIDDSSLATLGQWPWPRTLLATLVDKLNAAGARVVVFDIVFAEADRTSPVEVTRNWPKGEPYDSARIALAALPSNDQTLATSIRAATVVTGFVLGEASSARPPELKQGIAVAGKLKPADYVPPYAGGSAPIWLIEDAAKGNGSLNVVPDGDGIIRQVPLLVSLNGTVYPSAMVEALRLAATPTNLAVKTSGASGEADFGAATGIVAVKAGKFVVNSTANGSLYLHFTRHEPRRKLSAADVIDGSADLAKINGAIVWIGTSAAGLKDLRTTPLEPAAIGVEIQAQATETALMGVGLSRPDFARGAELVFVIVLGALIAFLSLRASAYWIGALAVLSAFGAAGFSWWAFSHEHWLLDPVGPSLAGFAAFLVGALVRFSETEGERSHIRRAFSQYLSEDVVRKIASAPGTLKLGGEARTLTIMFCDIRGFTSIAERYKDEPEALTALINRILTPLSRAVIEHDGTIDKYMGDCVMAFWNAPLDDADHAANASACALAMLREMDKLNAELQAERADAPTIRVGIGINTGPVVVGNMGSDLRFDYSVLGDAANLASRVQTYSANYGVDIAVAEDTAGAAPDFGWLRADRIAVKGKSHAADVFVLAGDKGLIGTDMFRAVKAAHARLFAAMLWRDWDTAEKEARDLAGWSPLGAKLYQLHLDRIAYWRESPPEQGWEGEWYAESK